MVIYLLFLFLLFVSFWNIRPYGELSYDIQLIILLVYQLWGCYIYRKRPKIRIKGQYKYLCWVATGIILSMIPAYLFFGQSIIQSFITYRTQFLLCTILTLLYISPRIEDIIKSLFIFSLILLIANVLMSKNISMFVIKESTLERIMNSGDSVKLVGGVEYVTIPLFYYLQKIKDNFNLSNFIKAMFLLFVIFTVQNRSTLFPAALFTLYTLFFIRSKYKLLIWITCAILIIAFITQNSVLINELLDETTTQLNDNDYNRNKAWLYFIFSYSPNWVCYILGNGFISAKTSNIMASLMEMGIFNADVGFIGYWNHFGIIPIIAIITMYVKVLKNKYFPYFVKLIVFFSIICSLTVLYYGEDVKIAHFAIFYYLFIYYTHKKQKQII